MKVKVHFSVCLCLLWGALCVGVGRFFGFVYLWVLVVFCLGFFLSIDLDKRSLQRRRAFFHMLVKAVSVISQFL